MTIRGVSRDFTKAMNEKLKEGRKKGYVGWDNHWRAVYPTSNIFGANGLLMTRLQSEVIELALAIKEGDPRKIRSEAADVANFAMFLADYHGE